MRCSADAVIIGAPQYHIGDYLNEGNRQKILKAIQGGTGDGKVAELNGLLKKEIEARKNIHKPDIYLHCSVKEHTYREHVHDMINDLEEYGYHVVKNLVDDYEMHSDVGKYYIPFLLGTCREILEPSNC